MNNVVQIKRAPLSKRTRMDTLIINSEVLATWRIPPFQRPIRVNAKVCEVAAQIKTDGGVIPGVLTLGIIEKGPNAGTYITDGQHRIEAFRMSEVPEGFADVRFVVHDNLAEMGEEFFQLNSKLVTMRPDDVLRALEESLYTLKKIRMACPFVGYDNIRRGPSNPIVSMSALLRVWMGSETDTPSTRGTSAPHLATDLTVESSADLVRFLGLAYGAWGRGPDVSRLWGNLNLLLCAWLWRRLVKDTDRRTKRSVVLTDEQFKRCLLSLGASADYYDWLLGRTVNERDRAPAYARIRALFSRRLKEEGMEGGKFPSPGWFSQ